MSAVKKTAKFSLLLLGIGVLFFVIIGSYIFVNMDSLAKDFTERAASDALGVPVTIGKMQILLDQKKVIVSDVAVANPPGYSKPNAITISTISVAGESFTKKLLTFSNITVDGTAVNLEVTDKGANLGALKKKAEKTADSGSTQTTTTSHGSDIKVIVKKFSLTKAQLTPSVTLLSKDDLPTVKVADIHLEDIGEKENGILAEEAIAQIMDAVLEEFNETANSAGFLEGLSLEALNEIGVSTGEVFKKNLKKSYDKEVDKFKKGFEDLKSVFE